jgi:hypothetical protein
MFIKITNRHMSVRYRDLDVVEERRKRFVAFLGHAVNHYSYEFTMLNTGLLSVCTRRKGNLQQTIDKAAARAGTTLRYRKAKR